MARKKEVEYYEDTDPEDVVNAHIRFPRDLHDEIVRLARANRLSLNRFVVRTMAIRVKSKGVLDE